MCNRVVVDDTDGHDEVDHCIGNHDDRDDVDNNVFVFVFVLCLCLQLSNLRVMWWDCDCRLFCICSQGSFFYICQVGKIG